MDNIFVIVRICNQNVTKNTCCC